MVFSSQLLRFLGLGLTSTSRTTVSDMVVILRISSNREDSPRFLGQLDHRHGDLQRWESIERDSGPISLIKSKKRDECCF